MKSSEPTHTHTHAHAHAHTHSRTHARSHLILEVVRVGQVLLPDLVSAMHGRRYGHRVGFGANSWVQGPRRVEDRHDTTDKTILKAPFTKSCGA